MNEKTERKQEEAFGAMFDRLNRKLDEIKRQNKQRPEIRNTETNSIQNNRQTEFQPRRFISKPTEERETTDRERPLPFYKQLTSKSINQEPHLEQNVSSCSVPTTIRPIDGTDQAYTFEEYLNNIVAAMIFSSGIEPVN